MALYGSDIDPRCVEAAACNLALTEREGLYKSCDALIASGVSEARRKQLQSSVKLLSERFTHDPINRPAA